MYANCIKTSDFLNKSIQFSKRLPSKMLCFNLKLLIIIPILLIIFKATTVHSKCEIYVDKESGVIPRFDINIGETVVQKNLIKNKFEIQDDVEVTGYCETSFR